MSVNEKMTALADEVRELSGAADKLGIDEMTTKIGNANDEIDEQADLLAQVITALDGKAAGGAPADPVLQDKTITPTTSQQAVTADSGYDGLDTVTVEAIPSDYVKPSATKAAATYTPGTSNQTIAAGTYCSGVQTIKGDTNLKAENIASGVSIFGVTGTHSGGENLESVLAEQQTLLNNLSAVLDNKASGGGGIDTCTVTLTTGGYAIPVAPSFFYTDGNMTYQTYTYDGSVMEDVALIVAKNTIMVMPDGWSNMYGSLGNCTQIFYQFGRAAYIINGDCSLIIK